jgi:hypothetical protein
MDRCQKILRRKRCRIYGGNRKNITTIRIIMKNYKQILEAINRGIQLALDDFEDEE